MYVRGTVRSKGNIADSYFLKKNKNEILKIKKQAAYCNGKMTQDTPNRISILIKKNHFKEGIYSEILIKKLLNSITR